MRIENSIIKDFLPQYDFSSIDNPENILFLDIETTGLSPRTSYIYMIGMAAYYNDSWHFAGLMAENPGEEQLILTKFLSILHEYKTIVHFNGNRFDLPFITERCTANGLSVNFESFTGIDIYKRINPYRHLLGIANCKQKTLEKFVGIDREDLYSGGELINVYKRYMETRDESLYKLLSLHNFEDISGMLSVISVLNIPSVFEELPTVEKVSADTYTDYLGVKNRELLIEFKLSGTIPGKISFNANDCYVSLHKNRGLLKIPVFSEELKYFYDNYKDYYYLPKEDMAVHKLVATYVDKAFREPAKASTCYTRLSSEFLPQWDVIVSPFFKRDYDSKLLFFELSDNVKTDRKLFSKYTLHILQMMKDYK